MFTNQTVVVVGAGASKEARLPTGKELTARIAQLLNIKRRNGFELQSGDLKILEALEIRSRGDQYHNQLDLNACVHTARAVALAMPLASSIDSFIESRKGDDKIELCGKLAIVRAILEAEGGSALFFNEQTHAMNHEGLSATWYKGFWDLLSDGCQFDDLATRLQSVGFVVFNYDRCIEHYLYNSIQRYYGVNAKDAAEVLASLNIYHPYGTVGKLPWQNENTNIAFGHNATARELVTSSTLIKTFSEGIDPEQGDAAAITGLLEGAKFLIFLGFAFHRMNMKLLASPSGTYQIERLYGTAVGLSDHDVALMEKRLEPYVISGGGPRIYLRNKLPCNSLFDEYHHALALG